MPKDNRGYSHAYNRPRRTPYSASSSYAVHSQSKNAKDSVENLKEWNEARCPVCMEHPHNAVLLLCSSHDKGCHPYMCDTSHRHSNCLDQFRKALADTPGSQSDDVGLRVSPTTMRAAYAPVQDRRHVEVLPAQTFYLDNKTQSKLVCPLCRGQVNGWIVVEPARKFMNAKTRDCACETCNFNGNYAELRKHARCEHPLVRPSEADPERQRDWRRMEQERDFRDVLSTIESQFGEDEQNVDMTHRTFRITLISIRFARDLVIPEFGGQSGHVDQALTSESGSSSRPRRRRTTYRQAEEFDTDYTDTEVNFLDDELLSDEGGPTPERH